MLKRLERAWRNLWIWMLTRLMRRAGAPARPDWGARPHRVLFLRHDRIGDMILSTGLLRVIAQSHPTIALDVLASPANAQVLREDPHVESVVVFDRGKPWHYLGAVRRLRRARYDAVIDCMPTAPSLTTLLLILATGARHRIGVAGRGNDAAFTLLVQPLGGATHIVDHLAALAAAFGVDPRSADFRPRLFLTDVECARAEAAWRAHAPASDSRRFLVNVSAGRAARRWPHERFVAAIRHLRSRDRALNVIVVGALNESEQATALARRAGGHYLPVGLRDAFALVGTADLVLSPNTSITHAASAFGRPAVVMCLPNAPAVWGLYGAPGYSLASPGPMLASLPVEPVIEALDRLLEGQGESGRKAVAGGGAGPIAR